ncbi:hypothetical protein AB0935_29840, partial [Streptomyces sp. NPDC007027]
MTTTHPTASSAYRITPPRVLHAEWHKLRSLRSSWITVISAVVMVLGVGLIMGATYTSGGGDSDVDTVVLSLYGSVLAQIFLVALGILMTAGEYTTGTSSRRPGQGTASRPSSWPTTPAWSPRRKRGRRCRSAGPGPERRKAPCHKGTGLSHNNCSAASYSPTGSPLQ